MAKNEIKLIAEKTDNGMEFVGYNKTRYDEFIQQAPAGFYSHKIEPYYPEKTTQQVRAIFGVMIEQTLTQAQDLGVDVSGLLKYLLANNIPKGELTKEFLHQLMYVICPCTDEDGKKITLSKMNTVQAAQLFERFRTIMAPLGIVIPDPDPDWDKK